MVQSYQLHSGVFNLVLSTVSNLPSSARVPENRVPCPRASTLDWHFQTTNKLCLEWACASCERTSRPGSTTWKTTRCRHPGVKHFLEARILPTRSLDSKTSSQPSHPTKRHPSPAQQGGQPCWKSPAATSTPALHPTIPHGRLQEEHPGLLKTFHMR